MSCDLDSDGETQVFQHDSSEDHNSILPQRTYTFLRRLHCCRETALHFDMTAV